MDNTELYTKYLVDHGISEESTRKYGLYLKGYELVIPIRNSKGDVIFNKYRNLNFNSKNCNSYKFRYDHNSKVALYNSEILSQYDYVFIAEGELDCIRLNQEGIASVSSTSGAGTFKADWKEYFNGKNVYIIYDNDKAGREGADNIALKLLGTAKKVQIVTLPNEYKDICEYFLENDKANFSKLVSTAKVIEKRNNNKYP